MLDWLCYWVFGEKQLFDKQGLKKQSYEEWVKRIQIEWAMDIESAYEDKNEIDFSSLE